MYKSTEYAARGRKGTNEQRECRDVVCFLKMVCSDLINQVKALYRRAKANVEMEKHSIAMVDIKAALEIDPENTELLHLKRKIAHHVKKEVVMVV